MMLYVIASVIGIIIGMLLEQYLYPSVFDSQIKQALKSGKKVIIAIDEDATIIQMTGKDRIRIIKAIVDFSLEEKARGMEFNNLDDSDVVELPHSNSHSDASEEG